MTAAAHIISQSEGLSGQGFALMALVKNPFTSVALLQANVSTATYEIWKRRNPSSRISGSLTVSAVIYDTLQTDSGWDADNYPTGFNFKWNISGLYLPDDDETYRVKVKLLVSSEPVFILHDHRTRAWN